ncbi:ATP-binding protein [Roseibacterium sp. SDUM158017]|uniref:ATP-binding protein n=1 Tax=Roseicyclus salinarum TaxID=3036773 RepID=UPI002414F110|nr:ATP-binding protein [Roseibacterium sp. SDUM158017]MDG4649270.1 ATP-binding protein [Roseibacterium sp. SDUM158017]
MTQPHRTDLTDPATVEAFDRLTRLASQLLGAPVSLLSVVDEAADRQVFKSQSGLPEPWASLRETPLSHSFCQHVKYRSRPLVVHDARQHATLRHNLAIRDLDVISYLGFPVHDESAAAIGSFCVLAPEPRKWTDDEIATMEALTATMDELVRQRIALDREAGERRRLEAGLAEAEASLRTREEFFAFMGHELRTPLTGIMAGARLALHEVETGGGAGNALVGKTLGIVVSSAESMKRTLDDLLDMSKLDAGAFEIAPRGFDLGALVDKVTGLQEGVVRDKGITLAVEWSLPRTLSERIGDDYRLEQILLNLLSNAIRFTDEGGVTLSVAGGEDDLRVELRDTGDGMSPEQLKRLFVPYRQADAAITRTRGGSGLGMAIVNRLVQAMGGSIEADSTPGEGTRIALVLPMPAASHRPEMKDGPHAAANAATAPLEGRRILVVDGHDASRTATADMLRGLGASVQTADAADEAVARALSPYLDSVVIGVDAQDAAGLGIIRTCRAAEAQSDLPLVRAVALVPERARDLAVVCEDAGFDVCLSLPTTAASLVAGLTDAPPAGSGANAVGT